MNIGAFFARLGFTRDDAIWGRLQFLTLAALISSQAIDLQYWAAYLGIHLSVIAQHWIIVIAAVILWIAGKNDTSDLKGKGASNAVNPRNLPPAAVILLAVALGGGALMSTSCAGNKPPVTSPAAAAAVKATEVVHALDAARDIAHVVAQSYPNVVTPADWKLVLTTHEALVSIIGASPNGWKPAAQAGLEELQKNLSSSAAQRLGPYFALVRSLVDAFVPAGL